MVLMYLYMVFTFEGGQIALISKTKTYCQEAGKKFAFGKIIELMTTVAKALQVCFLLPFWIFIHILLHKW